MKVVELKDALKKRNQSTRGNKPELKKRLLAAIANNAPLVANQDANRVDNIAGESFNQHAYWKLMNNENGEEMPDDRAAMQIERVQFRALVLINWGLYITPKHSG